MIDAAVPLSYSDIEALHRKYAPCKAIYDLVFTHCQIVCEIAEQLMAHAAIPLDADLIRIGGMLHDIGVYSLFDANGKLKPGVSYVTHGLEGEVILKTESFPEAIWRFASHHTGVGLSSQDVIDQGLPLPVADYRAKTDEELLIMYADKFHSKTVPPRFNTYAQYADHLMQFGADKVIEFEEMSQKFGQPDLDSLVKKYGHSIG